VLALRGLPAGLSYWGGGNCIPPQHAENLKENLRVVTEMDLPEEDKTRILGGNAKKLFKL
jgi:hypothetical protein